MYDYLAMGIVEGWIPSEDEDQVIEAWQYLHDTRIAYRLQGWYGRMAHDLIEAKIINP